MLNVSLEHNEDVYRDLHQQDTAWALASNKTKTVYASALYVEEPQPATIHGRMKNANLYNNICIRSYL